MNKKKLKQLRKRIRPLQVEWLKSLLKKEEADKVTIENVSSFLPKDSHYSGQGQLNLSFMSDKWIMKILKRNPSITSLKELQEINSKQSRERRSHGWMNTI